MQIGEENKLEKRSHVLFCLFQHETKLKNKPWLLMLMTNALSGKPILNENNGWWECDITVCLSFVVF